jgi:hypothetical protein
VVKIMRGQPGDDFYADGRHGWVRIAPETIVSWDLSRLGAARAKAG